MRGRRDNSGTIDRSELDQALQSFGYPLPRDLVRKLEKRFGERRPRHEFATITSKVAQPGDSCIPQPHQKIAEVPCPEGSRLTDS